MISELVRRTVFKRAILSSATIGTLFLAAAATVWAPAARSQTTSTIQGTVTDKQGLAVGGAELKLAGDTIGTSRTTTSDAGGGYSFANLPAGVYSLTATHAGFATNAFKDIEVTLNRTLTFNVRLEVGQVDQVVNVNAELPLLETNSSSTGSTILPQEIVDTPLNGRNYLDLLQLVPGVAINRHADQGSDTATPVLGERSNNTGFLIDGLPNSNQLNGGAAAQFNQDTIAEFQVITTGYAAEFGHASGGVVNVITKSGSNATHGLVSAYHRNNVFDTSDIPGVSSAPYLLRWDYDAAAGGSIVKDKVFWFGSAERIHENRQLNFVPVQGTPQFIIDNEAANFNQPTTDRETRVFGKFDQVLSRHHLTEQVNYTNLHIFSTNPLSAATSLPSTRTSQGDSNVFLGFSDTVTLGSSNPFILSLRGQYRRERTLSSPAHADAGPFTLFNVFSSQTTGGIFGDVAQTIFGATFTPSALDQKYGTAGASLAKTVNRHTIKFGWDFERTQVDGNEANGQENQLFATESDFLQFGPVNAGFFLLLTIGGTTPQANQIKLRNNYDGLWVQDDWKITQRLTVNAGVRWDYDSQFQQTHDFSPRLGFAYSINPKTVVRGSFGLFYDHFRLGIARDVPGFGGASLQQIQPLSYPRLFSGVPTIAPILFPPFLCLSPTQTDAQIAASGSKCPFGPLPYYGFDHLNNVVAAGHAQIPVNTPVNVNNIQQVSGLTPAAYLTAADAAIGVAPAAQDALFWGPFGTLSYNVFSPSNYPVTIDPSFATPYTRSLTFGVQRQITNDLVVTADYYHKGIENILGTRETDIQFAARVQFIPPGFVNGYGPWYSGTYDAGILAFTKRMSKRFTLGGSYAYVSEHDDALCSSIGTTAVSAGCYATDSFRGVPGVVSSPTGTDVFTGRPCGGTNATAPFFTCSTPAHHGNYVPVAGKFYDGASLDSGPSDFALRNTFEVHGLVMLPGKVQFSSVFRAQSGFRYSQTSKFASDQDGNGQFNGRDLQTGRNAFTTPPFVNMDLRIARTFVIKEKVRLQGLFEFFDLFNNANPAAIQGQLQPIGGVPFGTTSQRLPGREGQVGLKLEF